MTAEGLAASGDGWMEGGMGGGGCSWNIMGGSGCPGIAGGDDGRPLVGGGGWPRERCRRWEMRMAIFFSYILYYALLMVLFSYGLSMG